MKNLLLVVNLILLGAVAYLYYLNFKNHARTPDTEIITEAKPDSEEKTGSFSGNILFINTDSLWSKYAFIKQAEEELRIEKMKLEGQFKNKLDAFEKDYMDLQQKASKGLLSMEEGQKKEAELMQRQQSLMELKDELAVKLMEKEQKMNDKIQKTIYAYLEEFKQDKEVDFILGYTQGGGALLYGNNSLDITPEVISGLNHKYDIQKKETSGKK